MVKNLVKLEEFTNAYRESLGVEGAEQLLRKAILRAGLPLQNEFTREEALKICRELKQYGGFVGIIGGILNSRIIIR